jgi:hypothetical protein
MSQDKPPALSSAVVAVVRPDAPPAVRLAAARGEGSLSPADRLAALAVLAADRDAAVRQAARERLSKGPVPPLLEGVQEGTDPRILDILARARGADPAVARRLLEHPAVPETALARLAVAAPGALLAAVQDRQLPRAHRARIASAMARVDAAAAQSAAPADAPPQAAPAAAPAPAADAAETGEASEADLEAIAAAAARGETTEEFDASLTEDEDLPEGSAKKESLYKRVLGMTISQKIQLAFKGNKEARGLLVKDANKLVCGSVIKSPKVSETEIIAFANSRNLSAEVFRLIASNSNFTKLYQVRAALAQNPRVPAEVALRCLNTLNESDVQSISKSRNVSSAVQTAARRMVNAKLEKQRQKAEQLSGGH